MIFFSRWFWTLVMDTGMIPQVNGTLLGALGLTDRSRLSKMSQFLRNYLEFALKDFVLCFHISIASKVSDHSYPKCIINIPNLMNIVVLTLPPCHFQLPSILNCLHFSQKDTMFSSIWCHYILFFCLECPSLACLTASLPSTNITALLRPVTT